MRRYPTAIRSAYLTLLLAALLLTADKAAEAAYLTPAQVDVTLFIAPPPAPHSDTQKRDLKAVLDAQAARTPEEIKRANETEQLSVFSFADVLGPSFNKEKLPKTAALFQQIYDDTLVLLRIGKDRWNRPRPFLVSKDVQPSGQQPKSSAYPSGNAWLGHLYAIVLADVLPAKSAVIFARGRETGDNRVIAGVHFPTDLEGGRQAAVAMAAVLWTTPGFQKDLAAARAELQAAGL
ncbi:phosphatase PAP2 family protein [Pseudorhodoplanes sp.]|uniref:acid phosphatase n=1 Tax=Pseudorhodoplanes sp. TaxID=1934341 RepID=UPI002CE8975E|nr:phosphatase PAP2 family protein [Pseudorhodoplanes sp.]HWV51446.1 phosphatase PAP2 family protein [Pseudorhodoplanes sp.]